MRTRVGAGNTLLPAAMALLLVVPAAGQSPTTPLTPSEPHEALSFFEGSWTILERPAEQGFVETCEWLGAGRRHMMCRSRWRASNGDREGLSIFSYSESDSTYLYYGLRPSGAVEALAGRRLPDGWEFRSVDGEGSTGPRVRVTIGRRSSGFQLVAESSTGGGPWEVQATENYVSIPRGR